MGLLLFVCMRFQCLFHSPPGVLFAFPSQYLFAIGRSLVFSLGGWSPRLRPGFHVSRPTCSDPWYLEKTTRTGLSPSMAGLSRPFRSLSRYQIRAAALSLAATRAISVDFFSCSYLDVSVRRVRLHGPMYSARDHARGMEFPHSDTHGSKPVAGSPWLFADCRVLHRL